MAQGDLMNLLEETKSLLAQDTEWYRTFLNVQAHTYKNSVKNVTNEFIKEVGQDVYSSQKPTFDKLIRDYVATLYKRIAKTPRNAYIITEDPGSNERSFSITITPTKLGSVGAPRKSGSTLIYESVGSDPFKRIINDEKRTALKPLLQAVNVLLGTDYTSSTFLDTGHLPLGVAEKQTYSALAQLKSKLDAREDLSELAKASGVLARLKLSSKWVSTVGKSFTIEVTDESYKANRSKATNEKAFKANTIAAIEKIVKKNIDWANQKSSDSVKQAIKKELIGTAVASGAKAARQVANRGSSQATSTINFQATRENIVDGGFSEDIESTPSAGLDMSVLPLINMRLPPAVRENMVGPALHNRTGRFSESVKVIGATRTPQGFPSLEYTYQRSPYDVFDPVLGKFPWNTPGRDPKVLIEKSIRDVARDLAIGRFYVKRA